MRNIRLILEYDGTAYHGWQSQTNASTVQDTVTAAVKSLTGENCSLIGSSRTDTGVHALGYVCNFSTASAIPADKFSFALNTLLPDDITVRRSEEVPCDFHSRFDAAGKTYRYMIYNSVFPSALLRNRAYHVYYPLDTDAMNRAAQHLTGTHDFLAFSAAGGSVKTTVRTIAQARVSIAGQACELPHEQSYQPYAQPKERSYQPPYERDIVAPDLRSGSGLDLQSGRLIEFTITGNGFLYNMVRIIAGTLIEVGFGKLKPEDIPVIIESLDRRKAGRTAPAHGLYLVGVYYDGKAKIQKNEMTDDY
ncbi:MAG TPA: tRNA pseudouridine(38-40) synthase TruA [Clostridia bacterium]|nr:tRNA pseudouridine(38-40) synthase TruA [Clostridia bacterium]